MTPYALPQPVLTFWVSQHADLVKAQAALQGVRAIALSAELLTRHRYRPQAALVTLGAQTDEGWVCVYIDALSPNLHPKIWGAWLQELGQHATVWMHGAEHPLAVLKRDYGFRPRHFLDVQEAAHLLGWTYTGHEALVRECLGVTSQRLKSVDWSVRPLPRERLEASWARVHELACITLHVQALIGSHDLEEEWALASLAILEPHQPYLQRVDNVPDPRRYHRIEGARQLSRTEQAILATLAEWRDLKARELDIDPPSVLTNAQLIELAHAPQWGIAKLRETRFHTKLLHNEREDLIQLLEDVIELGPELTPRREWIGPEAMPFKKGKPDQATVLRLKALKAFRAAEAKARNLGVVAILPAMALEHLAYFPKTPLEEVPGLGAHRIARYGPRLEVVLAESQASLKKGGDA